MLEAFDNALKCREYWHTAEPIIYWEGTEELAVGEIDFHGERKYEGTAEGALYSEITPPPKRLWLTHGGGVKTIHTREGIFSADEMAALWCYSFLQTKAACGNTGAEVAANCYNPEYDRGEIKCRDVVEWEHGTKTDSLDGLLGRQKNIEEYVRDNWLEEEGLEIDRKYDHSRCPIDPERGSHGEPVFVGEGGITCHSCEAHGFAYGWMKKPGFVPYTLLVDPHRVSRSKNLLWTMARKFCHWQHAKHVLRHLQIPDTLAQLVYRAALKKLHLVNIKGDDAEAKLKREQAEKKIESAVGSDVKMVRLDRGMWVDSEDMSTPIDRGLNDQLIALPATTYYDDKGKLKKRSSVFGRMQGESDLTAEGYPGLHMVNGVDMWAKTRIEHMDEDGKIRVIIPANPPFRYTEKPDIEKAEDWIRKQFPGIDLNYLRLALYAKAFAQRGLVEPPMVYVWGQSGSGKTISWELAGEIGLSPPEMVKLSTDTERFKQKVASAFDRSDLVIIDEIAKDPRLYAIMSNLILSIKLGERYHHMYVGSRRMSRTAALLFADTTLAKPFAEDVQLRRRTVGVNLGGGRVGKLDWKFSCLTKNVRGWRASALNTAHADAFLSDVINKVHEFFTFEEAAHDLGYSTLDKMTADYDPNVDLVALFKAVCEDTRPITKERKERWKGKGWCVFHLETDKSIPVAKAWRACVGDCLDKEDPDIQRVSGAQWSEILKAKAEKEGFDCSEIVFEYSPHGREVGIRFRQGKLRADGTLYNGEILRGTAGSSQGEPGASQEPEAVVDASGCVDVG